MPGMSFGVLLFVFFFILLCFFILVHRDLLRVQCVWWTEESNLNLFNLWGAFLSPLCSCIIYIYTIYTAGGHTVTNSTVRRLFHAQKCVAYLRAPGEIVSKTREGETGRMRNATVDLLVRHI